MKSVDKAAVHNDSCACKLTMYNNNMVTYVNNALILDTYTILYTYTILPRI